jgi:S1-C subfamily serine protease
VYLLVAVVGGIVGSAATRFLDGGRVISPAGPVRPYTEVVEVGRSAALGEPIVQVVQDVGPSVVKIDTRRSGRGFGGFPFFDGGEREGEGSGFIINSDERLAITNNHVVENAQRIRVTLADKRTYGAELVGTDAIGDIALIRLDGKDRLPQAARFADSDKLQIGQLVVAIGNPLGFEHTVTQGVLSATGRRLEGKIENIPMEDLIQTDAAINPGNSGGPLLDAYGRVIGMNTAIISRAQGIGFAVASNTIKRAAADILGHGRVVRPWIGVEMRDLDAESAVQAGVPASVEGVVIANVRSGEPAARAGLQAGDVITRTNGRDIANVEELRREIRSLKPGARLKVEGFRRDRAQAWQIVLGEMPPVENLQ